jgi:CpeT/CpcT family (DUF1001)
MANARRLLFSARPARAVAVVVLLVLPLFGCADQPQKQEAALADLVAMVGGRYDTVEQARAESAGGAQRREALQLAILPVTSLLLGDHVFYVQESVAGDVRRITSQELMHFQVSHGVARLVASQLSLVEPLRWRDAENNPGVFHGLLPQDLKALSGCEIIWHRVAGGFDGATDPARCQAASRLTGQMLHVEQRYTLRAEGLTLAERRTDADGALVAEEPLLQFRRHSQ